MTSRTENVISTWKIAAILVIATGWGWNAGNFTPPDGSFLNHFLHGIPIVLLLVLSLPLLRLQDTHQHRESKVGWADASMSVFAIATIIAYIVMIILGASNPDPNAFGVKSLADWFPTIINIAGSLLWLTTLLPVRQSNAEIRTAKN